MAKLIDRLIPIVDRIRDRVNVRFVGVRRYRLIRVIRSWDGLEVGDGTPTLDAQEILPIPAIALGKTKDPVNGWGRVPSGTMTATEVSLRYTESFLHPVLSAGQELYYCLVELNTAQGAANSYWILSTIPEADRCETAGGNIQWLMNFTRATIKE